MHPALTSRIEATDNETPLKITRNARKPTSGVIVRCCAPNSLSASLQFGIWISLEARQVSDRVEYFADEQWKQIEPLIPKLGDKAYESGQMYILSKGDLL